MIEYTTALNELKLGDNSIISQVVFSPEISMEISNVFLHTCVVNKRQYVTLLFGIEDDLKSIHKDIHKLYIKSMRNS